MLASILLVVIIGIITFYQIFTQGIFSALIMAVLSIIAALVSLNYFEALAVFGNRMGLAGWGAQAAALMVIFILCLLLLRLLADHFIRGNMNFPLIIDRAGSAVFGLIAALVIGGMIALSFQLLPIPPRFLGFDRFENLTSPNDLDDENNLFPNADGFILWLAKRTSSYAFAGSSAFIHTHPDLQRESYLNRLSVDPGSRREASDDALTLNEVYLIETINDLQTGAPADPPRGETFLAVNFTIRGGGGTRENPGAKDVDGRIRFMMGNIRVVGYDENNRSQAGISRYPRGIVLPGAKTMRPLALNEGQVLDSSGGAFTLLFDWPKDIKTITPQFLEFKRSARKPFPAVAKILAANPNHLSPDARSPRKVALSKIYGDFTDFQCTALTYSLDGENIPIFLNQEMLDNSTKPPLGEQPRIGGGGAINFANIMVTNQQNPRNTIDDNPARLQIPEGFALIFVDIQINNFMAANFSTPFLLDLDNNLYESRGFALISTNGMEQTVEFAYSAFDSQGNMLNPNMRTPPKFPPQSFIRQKQRDARISKAVFYYLVPRQNTPLGIIGVRYDVGGEKIQWSVTDAPQMLIIPSR
ncbi:MAG: CvpA family protein [Sedimentisphaerales bacterium]|nr:CvpA family protein [Sedimentisphaerales bacterium]